MCEPVSYVKLQLHCHHESQVTILPLVREWQLPTLFFDTMII